MPRADQAADQAVRALLQHAQGTLDDARLLAEHRRPNESVLTRLALHQALQAISLSEGLDVTDELRLDTLFKRVPRDHPQLSLIETLRVPEAQTIAAVASLVAALLAPRSRPSASARPQPPQADFTSPPLEPNRDAPHSTPDPGPDPGGLTALGLSPERHGRVETASSFPSAAFWALMDRWRIGDLEALALVGHDGGLTKKGTRPRFRLQDQEAVRYAGLRALDTALQNLEIDPRDWLVTSRKEAPFDDSPPLALLQRDGASAARQILHVLNRQALKAALGPNKPGHAG